MLPRCVATAALTPDHEPEPEILNPKPRGPGREDDDDFNPGEDSGDESEGYDAVEAMDADEIQVCEPPQLRGQAWGFLRALRIEVRGLRSLLCDSVAVRNAPCFLPNL